MGETRGTDPPSPSKGALRRVVGVPGAVLLGLGSILGTGVFVSVGIAAGIAGPSVVLAVCLGALVALLNGLSAAQLAASHPKSGGTYEYGYRYLTPALGFSAGWMFLCAKSASAATAALGFAGYALALFGVEGHLPRVLVGLLLVLSLTALVSSGIQRSSRANALIVSLTLLGLGSFLVFGAGAAFDEGVAPFRPLFPASGEGVKGLLHATALMFVAYTGYGRVATLGEEIHSPERSIPRAIVLTLALTMALYVGVVLVAVGLTGAEGLAEATRSAAAPLEGVLERAGLPPALGWIVSLAAITAMAGVLLNLLLGLSRVLLAMARRKDAPGALAAVDEASGSPRRAVLAVGLFIAGLTSVGSVETTWSFSAFTVLVYYALTNLAALRLPAESRRYPRAIPALGLVSCLGLAFFVDAAVWLTGLLLLGLGLVWHLFAQRRAG